MREVPNPEERVESSSERGSDVKIALIFIRHGERDTKGNLTDLGRRITAQKGQEAVFEDEFDAVKAYGSPAGPKTDVEGQQMSRSVETAHIFGSKFAEVAGYELLRTRNKPELSYETVKNKMPYNHTEIYNAALPPNFAELPDQEKIEAARVAQTRVVDHLMGLSTPEALAYKEEVAGAYSYAITHYAKMASRLNSGSRVLMPVGVHSPMMEVFLQRALVRQNERGERLSGFQKVEEIGGGFNPSEGYMVDIQTDAQGNLLPMRISFENPERLPSQECYLDPDVVQELSEHYKKLHKEK